MQVVSYKTNVNELNFLTEDFPFPFSKGFSEYCSIYLLQNKNGIAPIEIYNSKFLTLARFHFAPLNNLAQTLTPEEELNFCKEAITFIKEKDLADKIVQPTNYCLFQVAPSSSISSPFGTYEINLRNKTNEELLSAMQARYRSAIRQLEGLNVDIKYNELDVFYNLHHQTMQRSNAYSEGFEDLKKMQHHLPNNTIVATIYINNELQGGLFVVYTNYGGYYLHGASTDNTQASGAIKYLHYKIMCLLKQKGVKRYDFVGARLSDISGTKLEGIQNFKKRFGSELKQGYLWKQEINALKCKSYNALLNFKLSLKGQKMPLDIIDQERKKL
ncbi:MAG: GNAT family N-acetyltransferase [Bacteroidota bacterium]|nr:GNAT family N-acetyltransferase [Bacteroidota bacterium]